MAGTGKSTIARTVAQVFTKNGLLGASFFFQRGESDRGNAARFFPMIAAHLIDRMPEMGPIIKKAINATPTIFEKSLKEQFENLILHPLLEASRDTSRGLILVVVVDALDECEPEEDIEAILQLLARVGNLRPISLRIFVTSRPEFPIRCGFKQMSDGTYQDVLLQEVQKETIEGDIALFLKYELEKIKMRRSLSDWPTEDQTQALAKMAIPLFISAATACLYIGDHRDNPKKRLDLWLRYRKTPFNLDRTYLPILDQLFDDEYEESRVNEFREIVGSIVLLESPLSIVSLANLLGIPKEDISCRLESLHSVLSVPDSEDVPVRLLHLSFREFLVDHQKQGKKAFWVDKKETHKRLASKCLELMSSQKGLRKDMCNLLMLGTRKCDINKQTIASCLSPELQYACCYWVHHLEQSLGFVNDGDSVHLFLQNYFLYWLEAMSLIGEVYRCISMIEGLQALVHVRLFYAFIVIAVLTYNTAR